MWASNSCDVILSVPEREKSKEVAVLDLKSHERAFGMLWSPESDQFGFQIAVKDQPLTRSSRQLTEIPTNIPQSTMGLTLSGVPIPMSYR